MIPTILAIGACALALIPAVLCAMNLPLYRRPGQPTGTLPSVSVLIPARNEERSIGEALRCVLTDPGVELEVIVMDDASTDATREIVSEVADRDTRVRLEEAPPLPAGWCGKQHACHALAARARNDVLLFIDADVRLAPGAPALAAGFLRAGGADLVSGFPRQITGTIAERLLIPLIHFVLLGFLPLRAMRSSNDPSFGAGCGQLMVADRRAYERSGGHAAIRSSRHDGIQLPRAFRRAGLRTDLFDATELASCRMYGNAAEVRDGLAKNATEGMAGTRSIVPWSVLLLGGQVLPLVLLAWGAVTGAAPLVLGLAVLGTFAGLATRGTLAWRFRQSAIGALLHPLGVLLLVAIQWYAWVRQVAGRPVAWKGRQP